MRISIMPSGGGIHFLGKRLAGSRSWHRQWRRGSRSHQRERSRISVCNAVRTPKKDGTWSYAVLVATTCKPLCFMTDAAPQRVLSLRIIKLSLRKYRKSKFIAQQVLLLLAQLAHNLMIWMKYWLIEAVEKPDTASENIQPASQGRQMLYDIFSLL